MTADQIRELRTSLEKAMDHLHHVNSKLYIAEAEKGPLAAIDASVEIALRAAHEAHKELTSILGETPRYDY